MQWRRGSLLALASALLLVVGCGRAAAPATLALAVMALPQAQADGPPPGGRLVFAAEGNLWLWQDGAVRQLTAGERFEGPDWSPDGTHLAASLVGTNHSDLVLLSSDGQIQARLTDNRGRLHIRDSTWARLPAWSPDGSRIAYSADLRSYDLALWTISPEGASPRQLFAADAYGGGLEHPTWAPDMSQLAVAGWRLASPSQIEIVTAATGRHRTLTQAQHGAYDPAWSPDGEWIAFVQRDGVQHDVWLVHPDGSQATRLTTTGRARSPTWSPDGRWLAFLNLSDRGFDVRVMPVPEDEVVAGEGRALVTGRAIEGPAGLAWGR
jgi:TolB protein